MQFKKDAHVITLFTHLFGFRVGRKMALILFVCINVVANVVSAVAPSLILFGTMRLLIGIAVRACNLTAFVHGL